MNCANHPEAPATAYCQFCGKPLCETCVHKVGSVIACEPCLAARVGAAPGQQFNVGGVHFSQSAEGVHYSDDKGNSFSQGPGYQNFSGATPPSGNWQQHPWGTEPWVAFGLGWIPGVGAMYNGQFAKGLVHVVVFALLVDMSHYNDAIGVVVAAWVFYQVFDAYQTAKARRHGLPLPNPLGLNDIGQWFSGRPVSNPWTPGTPTGNPSAPGAAPAAGSPPMSPPPDPFAAGFAAPPIPPVPPMPPVPPNQYDTPDLWHCRGRGVPTGAIVLIVLGVAFLLSNMGVLSEYWLERGWPILLIGIGIWLVVRRSQTPPPPGGAQ